MYPCPKPPPHFAKCGWILPYHFPKTQHTKTLTAPNKTRHSLLHILRNVEDFPRQISNLLNLSPVPFKCEASGDVNRSFLLGSELNPPRHFRPASLCPFRPFPFVSHSLFMKCECIHAQKFLHILRNVDGFYRTTFPKLNTQKPSPTPIK